MLIIKPIQDKIKQKEVCEKCRVVYRPECFAYSAMSDDDLVGICQFTMIHGFGEMLSLQCAAGIFDDEALFIMARAMMSFVDKCGVTEVIFSRDSSDVGEALIKQLGFKLIDSDSGIYKAVLSEIFACRDSGN